MQNTADDFVSAAESLKRFILSGCEKEDLIRFCDRLADKLGLDDKSELDSALGSTGTRLYCPDAELCERYGFCGRVDMIEDIREIAEEADASFDEVNDAMHNSHAEFYDAGFYSASDDEIIFVDLDALRAQFIH